MSRVSDLENKVAALERNVGMLAKLEDVNDCLKIAEYSSISHYKEGAACVFSKEEVKELENSRKKLDDIISEAKFANSLELIERINIALKQIGVEAKIVVNGFGNSVTIYHTHGNNKVIDAEKPKSTFIFFR